MCKITAIITTHNRAGLVSNAINSVLNQTFEDFELLIIDDASKDNTEEVIKTFTDDRIRYIKIPQEESNGANYARNLGIKESRGEFIAFLDDDDEWMQEKLEKQLKVFEKDDAIGLVYSGIEKNYISIGVIKYFIPSKLGYLPKDILVDNFIGLTSSVVIKKKFLEKVVVGLFDTQLPSYQEYDLFIRLCQICKVDFVKDPLLKYYARYDIQRISCSLEKYEKAYNLMNEKYKELLNNLDEKSKNQRKLNFYSGQIARIILSNNDKALSWNIFLKSLSIKFDLRIFTRLCLSFIGIHTFLKIKRKLPPIILQFINLKSL